MPYNTLIHTEEPMKDLELGQMLFGNPTQEYPVPREDWVRGPFEILCFHILTIQQPYKTDGSPKSQEELYWEEEQKEKEISFTKSENNKNDILEVIKNTNDIGNDDIEYMKQKRSHIIIIRQYLNCPAFTNELKNIYGSNKNIFEKNKF